MTAYDVSGDVCQVEVFDDSEANQDANGNINASTAHKVGDIKLVFDGTHRTLAAAILQRKVPAIVTPATEPLGPLVSGEWTFASVAQRMRKYFGGRK